MKTPKQTIRELRERIKELEAQLTDTQFQLRQMTRSQELVRREYDGFSRAVHQLAPYIKREEAKP